MSRLTNQVQKELNEALANEDYRKAAELKKELETAHPIPDVGDLVIHGLDSFGREPQRWRVDSWLCAAEPIKPIELGKSSMSDVLTSILHESCQEIDGVRMRWCLPEEATHVSLVAVCGTIAPIGECQIVGRVDWKEDFLAQHRESAMRLGREKKMVF
jgi:hypothetical protein